MFNVGAFAGWRLIVRSKLCSRGNVTRFFVVVIEYLNVKTNKIPII